MNDPAGEEIDGGRIDAASANKQAEGWFLQRRGGEADETGAESLSQELVCLSICLLLTVRPLHASFVGVPLP